MQVRHSSMLAQAHFLYTKTEPRIVGSASKSDFLQFTNPQQYYKPWELLPGDEEKIKAQVEEAEQTIDRESNQWDEDHPSADPARSPPEKAKEQPESEVTHDDGQKDNTVGSVDADQEASTALPVNSEDTNMEDAADTNGERRHTESPEDAAKDHGDDGGEVLVGEEDTVIY